MKKNTKKFFVLIYTLALSLGSILLFAISIQTENHASNLSNGTVATETITLPSGTKYKKVEYGQSFSIFELFSITPEDRFNLTVTVSNYSITKIGTTDVNVTFKKSGVTSNGLIRLTVVDTEKPIITAEDSTINENDLFNPLTNVTAVDNVDKDLTNKIVVDGTVDQQVPGEYSLTYTVHDSSKNIASIVRKVTVLPNPIVEEAPNQVAISTVASEDTAISEPEQTNTTTQQQTPAATETAPAPVSPALSANCLVIAGVTIPYQNGGQGAGQSIIDANYGAASTWGGAATQSGSDGMNTHFIGHNPGVFSVLFSVGIGSTIVVTDSSGQATTYIVNNVLRVDDYGADISTGVNYWDSIVGAGGGERITLQTCISDTQNLIIMASN